jgi:murein DD-endopeptidase MepM/ murein hydrolase activator NlpD
MFEEQMPQMGGLGQQAMRANVPQPKQVDPRQQQQMMLQMYTIPYTVKRGESLTKIASGIGISVQDLIKLNPEIRNPDRIFPNQEIRIPNPAGMRENSNPMTSPMMGDIGTPQPDPSRYSHQAFEPDGGEMMRQAAIGAGAAAIPMLAAGAPAAGAAMMGGLGRLMPKALPPAGRVAYPGSKGAVDWAGAKPAWNNVRPIEGGVGASNMSAQAALREIARQKAMQPRGMSGVPFNSNQQMIPRNLPTPTRPIPNLSNRDPAMSSLLQPRNAPPPQRGPSLEDLLAGLQ